MKKRGTFIIVTLQNFSVNTSQIESEYYNTQTWVALHTKIS